MDEIKYTLLFFSFLLSCSTSPPKKPPFRPIGELCQSRFKPLLKELSDLPSPARLPRILQKIKQTSELARRKYRPRLEQENLEVYFQVLFRLEKLASQKKSSWTKVKKKLSQSCHMCHMVYR